MGYALLWIEGLAVALLLVATLLACVGRFERRWLRLGAFLVVTLGLTLVFTALTVVAGWLQFSGMSDRWFASTLLLTAAFVAGAVWLGFSGLRRGDGRPAAAAWPRGKLALAARRCRGSARHDLLEPGSGRAAAARGTADRRRGTRAWQPLLASPIAKMRRLLYEQAFESMNRDAELRALLADEAWQESWNDKWTRWRESGKAAFDADDPRLRRLGAALRGPALDAASGGEARLLLRPRLRPAEPLHAAARAGADARRRGCWRSDAICRVSDGDGRRAIDDITALLGMAEHLQRFSRRADVRGHDGGSTGRRSPGGMSGYRSTSRFEELPTEWLEGRRPIAFLKRVLRAAEACRLATFAQVGEGQYAFGDLIDVRGHGDEISDHARTAFPYRVPLGRRSGRPHAALGRARQHCGRTVLAGERPHAGVRRTKYETGRVAS